MWALVGEVSGELISYRGRVLVHDNPAELGWLISGARTVQLQGTSPEEVAERLGRPVMALRDHPDMRVLRWPLDKRDFRS